MLVAICVVIAAIIAGVLWFPLFGGLSGENVLPSKASQWHLGKGAQYNPTMQYDISNNGTNFSAQIQFLPATKTQNQTLFVVINPNTKDEINQTIPINVVYDFNDVSDNAKPYFKTLDDTIFSVRDMALEDKYLVKGAVWYYVFIGSNREEVKVTDYSKGSFKFGSADAYTVSYEIGGKETKFWIVDNLPLPVKAEVYDSTGSLVYTYELTSLTAPLTPGFS